MIFSNLHFTQLGEEMIEQGAFGLTYLTVDNGLGNGVPKSSRHHIDIRQNSCSCLSNGRKEKLNTYHNVKSQCKLNA